MVFFLIKVKYIYLTYNDLLFLNEEQKLQLQMPFLDSQKVTLKICLVASPGLDFSMVKFPISFSSHQIMCGINHFIHHDFALTSCWLENIPGQNVNSMREENFPYSSLYPSCLAWLLGRYKILKKYIHTYIHIQYTVSFSNCFEYDFF